MSVPSEVLAAGWIPFVIVLVLILLFSFAYIRYYKNKHDTERCSTATAVLGLAVALFTCALVPVDIFLVSFMKQPDGQFKTWAKDEESKNAILNSVLYAYYVLYILMMVFIFLLLPVAYFYYEEGDDEATTTTGSRCCSAWRYSIVFILLALVLFMIGAFVPFSSDPNQNSTSESEWRQIQNIIKDLGNNHGENAISFMISTLTLVGMLSLVLYTASGMASWPVGMMKGNRSITREVEQIQEERATVTATRRSTQSSRSPLSARERRRVSDVEEQEHMIQRRERHLETAKRSWWRKCCVLLRPFEIFFGVVFFLLAALVFISLLLTCIDKILHSLGPKWGYALPTPLLPNPIDITLVYAQKVFPLDYILMAGLVMYLFFCSMAGIKSIGIWFCWLRMYKIRPRRTRPQGLLFLCFLLMFVVLALNVMVYQVAPQYSTYGSQHYVKNSTSHDNTTLHNNHTVSGQVVPCTSAASEGDCMMTRMSMLLVRFFYKLWFFGAFYYWSMWAYLAVFLLALVISAVRRRGSAIDGEVDEEDFDSDDEPLIRI